MPRRSRRTNFRRRTRNATNQIPKNEANGSSGSSGEPSTSNNECRDSSSESNPNEALHESPQVSEETVVNGNEPHAQNEPLRQVRLCNTMTLSKFKKPSNPPNNCIFQPCINDHLYPIPVPIKQQVMKKYDFYITPSCKVCEDHFYSKQWHLLPRKLETNSTFTAEELEALLNMLGAKGNMHDFENVINMAENFCDYWTGLTVLEFLKLVERLPLNIEQPKRALGLYLSKLMTGDSNEKLAGLHCLPIPTFESILKEVGVCLNDVEDSALSVLKPKIRKQIKKYGRARTGWADVVEQTRFDHLH